MEYFFYVEIDQIPKYRRKIDMDIPVCSNGNMSDKIDKFDDEHEHFHPLDQNS